MNRIISTLLLLFAVQTAWSQIPQTISYQGVLSNNDGTPVQDGNYTLTFKLYHTETGGAAIWTEIQTAKVINGIFNVILGKANPLSLPMDMVKAWM